MSKSMDIDYTQLQIENKLAFQFVNLINKILISMRIV